MRQSTRDKRNYVIVGLLLLVLFMTVGFAAFSTSLQINGTAGISTNWCVGFDNTKTSTYEITKGKSTGTTPSATMGYDGTACSSTYVPIANLGATFYQPGDKVEYTLTIANKGSVDAAIESITVDGASVTSNQTITKGNIIWKVYMPEEVVLSSNTGSTTMVVSAEFQNTTDLVSYAAHETQTIAIGINAVQGTSGMTITPAAQKVYAINTNPITKNTSTLQDIGTTYNSCLETGRVFCLRYTIENDTVTGAEACLVREEKEYCLQGWIDESSSASTPVYNANKAVLDSAEFTGQYACREEEGHYHCGSVGNGDGAGTWVDGGANAFYGLAGCSISNAGPAKCSGWGF